MTRDSSESGTLLSRHGSSENPRIHAIKLNNSTGTISSAFSIVISDTSGGHFDEKGGTSCTKFCNVIEVVYKCKRFLAWLDGFMIV